MGTKRLLFCLALCLALVGIYSKNVLETMKDLKEKTDFGKHFPRQGLLLLCWLLSQGKIDQNGKLHLNFNVANDFPYGIHQFFNKERIFPDVSNTNFKYYTLGSLFYKNAQEQLPEYITRNIRSLNHPKKNIDRVVIRVQKHNPTIVDEVYITEHYGGFTYMIGKQLLKEIEALCHSNGNGSDRKHDEDPDDQRFRQIKSKFPNNLHLHQFLYEAGYDADSQAKWSESQNINLELRSTWNRQARIVWDGIPAEMLKKEMKIGIYIDEGEDDPLVEYPLDGREHGEIDTHLALNPGLQVRLIKQITISEPVCETVPWKPVVASHPYFIFSQLFSLVYITVSNLCSLVYSAISNLFLLVYITVSSLFSLVYIAVSSLFSLVYIAVSSLFSLVYIAVSSLFSLVCIAVSSLFSLVYITVSSLFSLVYITASSLFSLVLCICQKGIFALGMLIIHVISLIIELAFLLLIGVIIVMIITVKDHERSRVPPQFISVSHGRPGF